MREAMKALGDEEEEEPVDNHENETVVKTRNDAVMKESDKSS